MYTNVKKNYVSPRIRVFRSPGSDRYKKKKHELFYFNEYSYTWNYINNIIYIHRHTTVTK